MLDLEFKLKPSRFYLLLFLSVSLVSLLIIATLALNLAIKCCLLLAVIMYVGSILWKAGLLRSRDAIVSIRYRNNREWVLQTPSQTYQAHLLGDSTVTRLVSVLRFRVQGMRRTQSCVIFQDSLKDLPYRKLFVLLKMV